MAGRETSPMSSQLSLLKHVVLELLASHRDARIPEPELIMDNDDQAKAFMIAGREDGVIAPTYLFHTLQLSRLIKPGDRVLDLACGPANQLAQVARAHPDADFIGVDASQEMLKLADATVQRFDLDNVRFKTRYIQDLECIPTDSMDVVMSTMSLHHLPDISVLQATLREAARVLKPDGVIYLADFSRLKRESTRRFFAEQHREEQSEIFTTDYLNSLRAAFTVQEFKEAKEIFGPDTQFNSTALVPFMIVMHRGERRTVPPRALNECKAVFHSLPPAQQQDFIDLKRFFALGGLSTPNLSQ
jgi:ubiquinone/menaquinone biosynthesis C-methylase UbiE